MAGIRRWGGSLDPVAASSRNAEAPLAVMQRLHGSEPSKDALRVLSLDGGGIRGIITLSVLAEIERRTGRPIVELFDHIAATSTGSFMAFGLALPGAEGKPRFTAARARDLYIAVGPEIFNHGRLRDRARRINLLEARYDTADIETVVDRVFGKLHVRQSLCELSVTAYSLTREAVTVFSRSEALRSEDNDYLIKDVIRAATAAPSYFDPYELVSVSGSNRQLMIDGAIFAPNPAMVAFTEAQWIAPDRDIILCSVGTGSEPSKVRVEGTDRWGAAQWSTSILGLILNASAQSVDYEILRLLGTERYFRFQVKLDSSSVAMDNVSKANVEALAAHGARLVDEMDREIDALCSLLIR